MINWRGAMKKFVGLCILIFVCCICDFCDAMRDCLDINRTILHTDVYERINAEILLNQLDQLEEGQLPAEEITSLNGKIIDLKKALVELQSDKSSSALLDSDIISTIIFRINELMEGRDFGPVK